MLSHHERQELERIQQWFELDDPQLARALGQGSPPRTNLRSRLARLGMDALAIGLVVLGAVTLNFGLIFFGAVMLAVAACLHVTHFSDGMPTRYRRLE
ncbi:Protein of unknown function (DUF3040) [Saccharomonospora marina XMU15]|uniref:DUF3040 domain-containing protein n=1 Tax=Saccharomonospora marina XMU15 TaxID=882083 RepID=H5WXC2_9PSEU|nr:DUF3040 domain-containing protein [Saccharomonospora marina]EHR49451.1 Protein of unknown function (DUF3040) [Saccharomonospora marina XMU15]